MPANGNKSGLGKMLAEAAAASSIMHAVRKLVQAAEVINATRKIINMYELGYNAEKFREAGLQVVDTIETVMDGCDISLLEDVSEENLAELQQLKDGVTAECQNMRESFAIIA